ncbi:MAG: Mth938-like domain-containing protein [Candidatus Aminicenantes bacterium]|nr:Mth938-like domain-containing protein [Candidatus Aminicenantes bacterium]
MTIEDYAFGRIRIEGRSYTSDVLVFPDRVDASWWRKEGHRLRPEDLAEVVAAAPEVLVVGTGALGVMRVPEETVAWLRAQGIDVRSAKTGEAVEIFNDLAKSKKAVAALHLTC